MRLILDGKVDSEVCVCGRSLVTDKISKVVDSLLFEQQAPRSDLKGRIKALAAKVAGWTGDEEQLTLHMLETMIWAMSMDDDILREMMVLAKKMHKNYGDVSSTADYLRTVGEK